ncbi:MAG TPA: SDR family NAD(P)-dependent oxidoreductase [Candidatus Eisenbacteria bacterium]|nr:SDR family NAD(P)-dependent oxidoreductase [Candidatus Eisenbacteria bacterium]
MASDSRVALVTGGGGAIGGAICRRLAADGAIVWAADIALDGAERTVADLAPGAGRAVALDVTDPAAWNELIDRIEVDDGRLDVLVNNAATHHQALVEDMDDASWRRVMSTNADGVFYGCRRAVRSMRDRGRGGVIVSIVTGQFGVPYSSAYTASKFLVQGFSKCLALEVARHGIRVNTVAPGVVPNTGFERWYRQKAEILGMGYEAFMQSALDAVPLHAFGRPEDIAEGVAYLVSDAARYVTGHLLDIDGGFAGYQISLAPEGGWPGDAAGLLPTAPEA